MIEEIEILNFCVSILLLIYMLTLLKKFAIRISGLWLACIGMLILANVLTIVEGFVFPEVLNIMEHVLFTLACLCFLLAVSLDSRTS